MIIKIDTPYDKAEVVSDVLHVLPIWFGIEESTQEYIENARELPVWVSKEGNEVQGVLVGKLTSDVTMELYVMGVKEAYHRNGIGTALFQAFYE